MLKSIKNNLQDYISAVLPQTLIKDKGFSVRIKKRHKIFWTAPDAETIRNTVMAASDPIEKWEDVENWQRKLSNKRNAREFAGKHNCIVPDMYWRGRDYNSINFGALPRHYIVKPAVGHSSGLVFLMKNGINLMDGKTYSTQEIRAIIARAVAQNEDTEFLIEEFLKTENGEHKIPDDYKFYMFSGQIAGIQVINRFSASKGLNSWYDENWNEMISITSNYEQGKTQPAPKCLPEMIEHAKKLSKAYKIFARIDFYATDKGAVFGEFTPTPAMGNGFTPKGDKLLSEYWDKYCNGMV